VIAMTTTWYAARAGGVVAYALVTLSVLAGITLAGKTRVPGLPRFAVEDIHRFLGLLAGTFIGVHVTGIALDAVVPFSLSQLVLPFTATYRPLWTGLGVVALELMVAVAVSNRLRRRLAHTLWRRVHYLTLVVWVLATVHGVMSGTDRDQVWLRVVYAVAVASVVAAMGIRVTAARTVSARAALATGGLAIGSAMLVVTLAGTHQPRPPSTAKAPTRRAPSTFAGRLQARLESGTPGLVSVSGTAGAAPFRIDLVMAGDRVTDTALQLRLGTELCSGRLTSLDTGGFGARCTMPDGSARSVTATWTIDNDAVSGQLRADTRSV
jgi:sulfoxide reductase heme-binding subunit YedZ